MTSVAVVIGASSNLGYQVLKKITKKYKGKIYFTTDEQSNGFNILDNLKVDDIELEYRYMDITDTQSIINLRHHIQDKDGHIDLIINNNEYVSPKKISHVERVRRTLSTNVYSNINFGNLIYPLLRDGARVVNVTGPAGLLDTIENEDIRKRISDSELSEESLVELLTEYEFAVKRGTEVTEGWGVNVQSVSKVAMNALTFMQHRKWCDKGVVINSVNPGKCQSIKGKISPKEYEDGADAILYLALEAPLHLKGNFVWSNFASVDWNTPFVEVSSV